MNRSVRASRWYVVIAGLFACAPETSPGETDGDSGGTTQTPDDTAEQTTEPTTNAGGDDAAPLASCDCLEDPEEAGGLSYDRGRCGGETCGRIEVLCDDLSFQADPPCMGENRPIIDLEALDCSLELLIAGTPSLVSYSEGDNGFYAAVGTLKIGEGRLGLTQTSYVFDRYSEESALGVVPLRDAAYFTGCKAMNSALQRYECMKDWTDGAPLETCEGPASFP